jgi:hypothetical protein
MLASLDFPFQLPGNSDLLDIEEKLVTDHIISWRLVELR